MSTYDFDLMINGIRFFQTSTFGFNGESMAFAELAGPPSTEISLGELHTIFSDLLGDDETLSARWDEVTASFISISRDQLSDEDRTYITKWVQNIDAIFASDLKLSEKNMWASLLDCKEMIDSGETHIATQRICDNVVFELYRMQRKAGDSYRIYKVSPEGKEFLGSAGGTLEMALHSLDVKVWAYRKTHLRDDFDIEVLREHGDLFDFCPAAPWEPEEDN